MAFTVALPAILASLDEMMPGNIQQQDYRTEAAAVAAQLQRQTVRFDFIQGSGKNKKKRKYNLIWLSSCAPTVEDCSDECVAGGDVLSDNSEEVEITGCKQVEFKVNLKDKRTSPFQLEEEIALNLTSHIKALDEYLNTQYIAFLAANKGTHEFTLPVGADNAGDWEIASNEWTEELAIHFELAARFARFNNPYLLDGLNLYTKMRKAAAFGANDDGRGAASLYRELNVVFDPISMSSAAPDTTFMVNPGSVALVTDNWWDAMPMVFAGNHRTFTIQSRALPGVSYDVHEIETCTSNEFVTSWQIRVNYEFVLNPEGCTADRTGILSFKKIAGI
jgi:hypothetical protein